MFWLCFTHEAVVFFQGDVSEGARVLLTENLLPRIARQITACLGSIRG